MKRILAALFFNTLIVVPAMATPLYTGIQLGDDSIGALLGYQINKRYAVEGHFSRSDSNITHAGITVDSTIVGMGVTGIALFPMQLNEVLPYFLFAKAGLERTTNKENYSIPSSVTLTLPFSGNINSHKNQFIVGGGAEYGFTKNIVGRMGIDFVGKDRTINVVAIFQF